MGTRRASSTSTISNLTDKTLHEIRHGVKPPMERPPLITTPQQWDYIWQAFMEVGRSLCPDFAIDQENQFAYINALRWLMAMPNAQCYSPDRRQIVPADPLKGLYIAGNTGTGKSLLVNILFALMEQFSDLTYKVYGETNLLRFAHYRSNEITSLFAETGNVGHIMRARRLIIQDLGSEGAETLYMGNRTNVLRDILEWRGDQPTHLTIITSNDAIDDADLLRRYGERVTGRLLSMCNYYSLTGKNRRK